jgi:hypothetical protein
MSTSSLTTSWHPNWTEARARHCGWWQHQDFVVACWAPPQWGACNRDPEQPDPGLLTDRRERHENAQWRAESTHWALARASYPLDTLPCTDPNIGPGSLALMLGAQPGFSQQTVWFHPCWEDIDEVETLAPVQLDPDNHWLQVHEQTCRAMAAKAAGRYLVGCPDLVENIDILASLRGTETVLMDMLEEPDWVERQVRAIDQAWLTVFDRLRPLIQDEYGGNAFGAFRVYGPGRCAKLQCDASAMFSPALFERFVVPSLSRQCAALDQSLFHLDGSECLHHLDLLLGIDTLTAIEWTPDPNVPPGGDPHWYPMYREILGAGKGVQVLNVPAAQVCQVLDAIGTKGVYILAHIKTQEEAAALTKALQAYRR